MAYIPLYELFPEVTEKETRTLIVQKQNPFNVPAGGYGLVELYCNDEDCDCQRVFLDIVSSVTKKSVAVITFGWESKQFYTKWFCRGKNVAYSKADITTRQVVDAMHGIHLNKTSRQSPIARNVLQMIATYIADDEAYVNRLKRHYALFRAEINKRNAENKQNAENEQKQKVKSLNAEKEKRKKKK